MFIKKCFSERVWNKDTKPFFQVCSDSVPNETTEHASCLDVPSNQTITLNCTNHVVEDIMDSETTDNNMMTPVFEKSADVDLSSEDSDTLMLSH